MLSDLLFYFLTFVDVFDLMSLNSGRLCLGYKLNVQFYILIQLLTEGIVDTGTVVGCMASVIVAVAMAPITKTVIRF